MWRVYTYVLDGLHNIVETNRTEEVFEFPNDAIPFRTLKLFEERGWVVGSSWDPDMDGNTIYFDSCADDGYLYPVCELHRE